MISEQLDNCRLCGSLFLKNYTDYCKDCCKEVEEKYNSIAEYLKKEQNRNVTLEDVSASTGVSLKQIAEFIRDGRIYAEDFPNLGYSCAHCSKLIKKQLLCVDCFDRFSTDLNKTLKIDKLEKEIGSEQFTASRESKYWRLKK
ncbi:flagellar protein [Sporosarcina jiandibaonis]|uniref:flagellar protein n=1 Tax=Sporosarcina jiandibaonis TaxID=2715535 RepID=UPI0015554820|nr:flagellar protein [Sporosarcina jiandibaonis]